MIYVFRKIVNLIGKLIGLYRNVKISNTTISIAVIKSRFKNIKGTKEYPISICNSNLPNVIISEGVSINGSILSGDIHLNRFVSLNHCRVCAGINRIEIGSFTSIGPNTVIQEVYHRSNGVSTYHMFKNIFKEKNEKDLVSKGDIIIGEDVWIGANCTILSGVKIGRGAIIGAGSVVTKDVSAYSIVVGNPARTIKMRFDVGIINTLERSRWWEWSIDRIISNKAFFEINIAENADVKEKIIEYVRDEKII